MAALAVSRHPSGPALFHGGAVAQLGERLVRNEEVRGSTPLGSTKLRLRPELAAFPGENSNRHHNVVHIAGPHWSMPEVSKPPNIFPRNGVYYYRRRVPRDLVEHLGRREIKKSLKTGSNAEARVRGNLAACDFDRLFAEARKARSLGSSATGSRVASYDSREARSIIHKYVELTSSEQLRELQNIDLHGDDELHADLGGEAAEIVSDLSESSRIYTRQSIYALERELFGPDGVKLQNPTERPDIETLLRLSFQFERLRSRNDSEADY